MKRLLAYLFIFLGLGFVFNFNAYSVETKFTDCKEYYGASVVGDANISFLFDAENKTIFEKGSYPKKMDLKHSNIMKNI